MSADDAVRMLDLARLHGPIRAELAAAMADVMESRTIVLGPHCEAFERAWSAECAATQTVGIGSGLAALTVALRGLGVGPGDEVIVPAHTFIATWLAVSAVGATPVPVDVDEDTYVLTPEAAEARIGPRTAAALPVHLYGLPVDIEGFEATAQRHGIALLFDAAQAHGATWQGAPVGGWGSASAWSFYPGKNLGALGEAGAVTTNDLELASRLRRLRDYGRTSHDEFAVRGSNDRLDELQAAVLEVKSTHLSRWQERRMEVARRYLAAFAFTDLTLPGVPIGRGHAWHQFVVRSPRRDEVRRALAGRGVETGIHYRIPPHRQPAYADSSFGPFPVAERLADEILSLPIAPHLTDHEVDRVVAALASAPDPQGRQTP